MASQNNLLKRYRPVFLLVLFPLSLGLFSYALAQVVLQPIPPFLYTANLGILGVVFGASVPEPGILSSQVSRCLHSFSCSFTCGANSRRNSSIR